MFRTAIQPAGFASELPGFGYGIEVDSGIDLWATCTPSPTLHCNNDEYFRLTLENIEPRRRQLEFLSQVLSYIDDVITTATQQAETVWNESSQRIKEMAELLQHLRMFSVPVAEDSFKRSLAACSIEARMDLKRQERIVERLISKQAGLARASKFVQGLKKQKEARKAELHLEGERVMKQWRAFGEEEKGSLIRREEELRKFGERFGALNGEWK